MLSKAVETKVGFAEAPRRRDDGRAVECEYVTGARGHRRRSGQPVEHGQSALGRLWRGEHAVEHAQPEVGQRTAAIAADAGRRGRGQRWRRGRSWLYVTVAFVHEVTPLSIRAISGRVERAARFRLVLGVSEYRAQVLFAVRKLALVAIRALNLLDVLATHLSLVPRAHVRLRRQRRLLVLRFLWLLLLLLLFTGSAASATSLSRATSRFRRYGSLVAATAAASTATGRRHHLLPPVFHFCDYCAWSVLRLQKTNATAIIIQVRILSL